MALERVEADDRANARGREVATKDWTTRALVLLVIGMFIAAMLLLTLRMVPDTNRDAVNQMIGVLYLAVGHVLGYYFGSSAGSRTTDAVLRRVAEGKR